MTSTRWSLKIREENGRAIITLMDSRTPVGIANIAWVDYAGLARTVVGLLRDHSFSVTRRILGDKLWKDAIRLSDDSTELAMQKLKSLGLTGETVDICASEIAAAIAQVMVGFLPLISPSMICPICETEELREKVKRLTEERDTLNKILSGVNDACHRAGIYCATPFTDAIDQIRQERDELKAEKLELMRLLDAR